LSGNERSGSEIRVYDVTAGDVRHILHAHGGRGEQILFLPGGEGGSEASPYLLTRGNDSRVRLWHTSRWRELGLPAELSREVSLLAAGWEERAGRPLLLAGHGDGSITLWDARRWQRLQRLELLPGSPAAAVRDVALGAGGGLVAAAGPSGGITVWDSRSGEVLGSCVALASTRLFFAGGAEDPLLITLGEDGLLRSWDPAAVSCPGGTVNALAISGAERPFVARVDFLASGPGASVAAAGMEGPLFLWDVGEGQVRRVLDTGGPVGSVAFSPEGLVAAGGVSGVRLWEGESGAFLYELGGHVAPRPELANVLALSFSPPGNTETAGVLASADRSGLMKLWRLVDGAMLRNIVTPAGGAVTSLSFSPDGYRLLVGGGGGVTVWQPRRGERLQEIAPAGAAVAAPGAPGDWQADWEMIAVLRGPRVDLYGADGAYVRTLQAVPAGAAASPTAATAAAFLRPDPNSGEKLLLATGHDDGWVRLWDPVQGTLLEMPAGHPGPVTALAVTADGCRLVSAAAVGTVRVDEVCDP
jgi:WD40 repeat protein